MHLPQLAAVLLASTTWASPLTVWKRGDVSGCGKLHILKGITQYRTVKSSGKDRSYGIHLPASYSKDHQYPTILGFHGSSSIGFFFEADTLLDLPKYTGDKLMVYPNGLGGAWAGANYSKASIEEDLQFVWDMLADIRKTFCVDSSRIYATGMSIGGGFVDTIACNDTVGGEFAAFAAASGSFTPTMTRITATASLHEFPTPMLEFHGGADADVKYDGGEGEVARNHRYQTGSIAGQKRNQCDEPNTKEDLFDGDVHHLSWNCKGQKGALQHYKTDDQKHDWPARIPNFSQLAAGDKPTHLEASAIIQDFFMKFTRPAS